jgi:hypothetical protein
MPSDSVIFTSLLAALDNIGLQTLGSPILIAFAADFVLRSPSIILPPVLSKLSRDTLQALLFFAAIDKSQVSTKYLFR